MIRLRPYKPGDAAAVASWFKDEETFLLWGGTHFGAYPLSPETLNRKYLDGNGDCPEPDNFYPMIAYDDDGPAGCFIIRYLDGNKTRLRFGWVVVDDAKRGRKVGQTMLRLGFKLAFEIMSAERVTIGVFEQNAPALRCYRAVGFHKSPDLPDTFEAPKGEPWRVVEMEILRDEYLRDPDRL